MQNDRKIVVVGAGPVGCVLSVLLARRGFDVTTYEKRPDMRRKDLPAGRSINLVLTRRGLRALEIVGLREAVLHLTVPVLGRMMHSVEGELAYQPYGKDDSECNYSVSRGRLNEYLLDAAERAGCRLVFDHELQIDADLDDGELVFVGPDGEEVEVSADVVIGCDGAGSAVRQSLVEHHGAEDSIEWLEHGYKELLFPTGDDGDFAMAGHALHIWPRGDHMLMGLANNDRSFTGTIYLRNEGPDSFAELSDRQSVLTFFERYYPDAIPLLTEDFEQEFVDHPLGHLGTVRCAPWYFGDRALLVGDAAHAIVPFFGQGLNCGFEDCAELDRLLDDAEDFGELFEEFYRRRKSNADAIADMAIENFVEMRDLVADEHFLLKKAIEHRIEQEMPQLYRSRYATVMYSYNDYRDAYDAGEIQAEILEELAADVDRAEDVDLGKARALILERLTPFYDERDVELEF
jgi:kynurenine 3-monooxygenase